MTHCAILDVRLTSGSKVQRQKESAVVAGRKDNDMTDEQIEQLRAALQEVLDVVQRAWQTIVNTFALIARAIVRWYREARRAHLIPRQYRNTIMRRKLRKHFAL